MIATTVYGITVLFSVNTHCHSIHVHCESKKGATLSMAITLSVLDGFAKFFHCTKSSKFPTKSILGYPPHLKYVAALPW